MACSMSQMGQKPKSAPATPWSAPTLKADLVALATMVGFGPLPDSTEDLVDHFGGGGQKRVWHGETERLRGLEIYHQLILKWLLHWQISRFLTL